MLGRRQIQGSFRGEENNLLEGVDPIPGRGEASVPFVTSHGAGFNCIFWHMSPKVSLSGRLTDRVETSRDGVEIGKAMFKASFAVPTSTFPHCLSSKQLSLPSESSSV